MRSLFKVPYVDKSIFNSSIERRKKQKAHKNLFNYINIRRTKIPLYLLFWKKGTKVNKKLVNKRIGVYNGKLFMFININRFCVGFRLGEFILTKRTVKHKLKYVKRKKLVEKGDKFKKVKNFNLTLKKYMKQKKEKKWA